MRCPVCQARFRKTRRCSRCGADLASLMLLALKSWRLRQLARDALAAGDLERASRLAEAAQSTQRTPAGEALWVVTAWCQESAGSAPARRP